MLNMVAGALFGVCKKGSARMPGVVSPGESSGGREAQHNPDGDDAARGDPPKKVKVIYPMKILIPKHRNKKRKTNSITQSI